MPKTFSQKIARGFELTGYIYFLLFGWLAAVSEFHPLALTIQALNGFLLGGFILHSRGKLNTRWFGLLWIANFIFYLIFTFIFVLFALWAMIWITGTNSPDFWLAILVLLIIGAGLLAGLFFSFIGLAAHREENGLRRRTKLK